MDGANGGGSDGLAAPAADAADGGAATKKKRRSGPRSRSSPYVSVAGAGWQQGKQVLSRQPASCHILRAARPAHAQMSLPASLPAASLLLKTGVTQYKRTGNWEAHIWVRREKAGHSWQPVVGWMPALELICLAGARSPPSPFPCRSRTLGARDTSGTWAAI